MTGILNALIAGVSGAVKDTYFNLVTLLLPGNGTNGATNNSFVDSSTANSGTGWTITRNGDTTQGTFSPFSQTGWGNYLPDQGNNTVNFTSGASSNFQFTGDFTIESWVYPDNSSGDGSVFVVSDNTNYLAFNLSTSGNVFNIYLNNTTPSSFTADVPIARWSHVAMVRSGSATNNIKVYVDGQLKGQLTNTSTLGYANPAICRIGGGAASINRYYSNLRVCKFAVYTTPFTPSTTPLTSTSQGATNCVLLTAQSNRFVNNVAGATATITGSPSVTPFSPFAPTSSYSAAAVGGSGYFDGSGDYLRAGTASDWAFLSNTTAAWTIEFWVYNTTSGSSTTLFDTSNSTTANVGVSIQKTSSEYVNVQIVYASAGNFIVNGTSTSTLTANTWNHVFISYNQSLASSNLVFYINGVAAGTANKTANTPSSSNPFGALSIGTYGAGSGQFFTGYFSSARISNVVRTPPSSVPTSPYTSDTDTKLLLNFTNANVVDATAKNVLETEGNAQISTAQSKWGGGSIYLDGTSNTYVKGPVQIYLGSSNFTMEGWVRFNSVPGAEFDIYKLQDKGDASSFGALRLILNSGMKLKLLVSTTGSSWGISVDNLGNALSTGVWYYIAITRSGNDYKVYVNGSQAGATQTLSGSLYAGPINALGWNGVTTYSNMYFDDVRLTIGQVRDVTASPTAPFPVQ
jgi:hypothetical protein